MTPNFLLISGIPRTGTTLMIKWLNTAWPDPKICLRESGITDLIYYNSRLLDFVRNDHDTGIDFVQNNSDRKLVLKSLSNWIIDIYKFKSNQDHANWILDKMPLMYPFSEDYYKSIVETFPEIKIIFLIRSPIQVISSMLLRTWTRGPYPKLNYMSPFIEDQINFSEFDFRIDNNYKSNEHYLNKPLSWSLRKCCRMYSNALEAIHSVVSLRKDWLLIDYQDLTNNKRVKKRIENQYDISLSSQYEFKSSTKQVIDLTNTPIYIEEIENRGVHMKYKNLLNSQQRI